MHAFLDYLLKNKEWLFSGIGVAGIGALVSILLFAKTFILFLRSRSAPKNNEQAAVPSTTNRTPRNRITFADGTIATVEAEFVYHVVDPVAYTYVAEKPLAILISLTESRCRQMLESHSILDARRQRGNLGRSLVDSLQPDFAKYGLRIDTFNIGIIEDARRSTAHKISGAAPKSPQGDR
jgi:regulator of protease activity HflC (stomatin/prohibitin superfamily)